MYIFFCKFLCISILNFLKIIKSGMVELDFIFCIKEYLKIIKYYWFIELMFFFFSWRNWSYGREIGLSMFYSRYWNYYIENWGIGNSFE